MKEKVLHVSKYAQDRSIVNNIGNISTSDSEINWAANQ